MATPSDKTGVEERMSSLVPRAENKQAAPQNTMSFEKSLQDNKSKTDEAMRKLKIVTVVSVFFIIV
jgi:hypothetical protein